MTQVNGAKKGEDNGGEILEKILDIFVRTPALETGTKDSDAFGVFVNLFMPLTELRECVSTHGSEVDPEFQHAMTHDASGELRAQIETAIERLTYFVEGGELLKEDHNTFATLSKGRIHGSIWSPT